MKCFALVAGVLWMTGCATGGPMGGQMAFEGLRYRPLTPSAAPRDIPEEAESPAPALAQGPVEKPSRSPASPASKPAPRVARAPAKKPASPARSEVSPSARDTVLATARALVGQSQVKVKGRPYSADCTGLVEAAYASAGIALRGTSKPGDNGVTAIYRHAQAHGRVYTRGQPAPGDIVFFRETYDQNRDGRRNDGLTHVGLVDKVAADGTVTVIHRVKRGVVRYRMNLAQPSTAKDARSGQVLNDTLRAPSSGHAFALTGQLFAAYATVLPAPAPVAVASR
ncbi:CHAP domain-containing protein [Stigmatella sp. ncwal1]|uniref:CHAP domain-containing protein n=1 Tax=Stigmatella ashevillensis TaxID=2995309 RepID=A0ABT5D2F0_9BACT|nr:CHAP domain-containing protein [Stigmatella ashevillena]MDC0707043.1 CHAP domain-containing protein [Stigmatella ashevillena]